MPARADPRARSCLADKFKTTKDPDAVADFYSTEDFLQILGIFPMAIHFVLAGVEWDTKREQVMNVWNAMQISFDITEKEEVVDGKDVVTMFNKRALAPLPTGPETAHPPTSELRVFSSARAPMRLVSQASASSTTSRTRRSYFGTRCRTMASSACRTDPSR